MKHFSALLHPLCTRAMLRLTTLLRPLASVAVLSLTAIGGLSVSGQALAQGNLATVTPLYNFSSPPSSTRLVQDSAGNFYGTQAPNGGLNQVYRFSPAGIFTSLYLFQGAAGAGPQSLIMGADGNLYGVATSGGIVSGGTGAGTVFRLTLTGEFTLLHTFNVTDGSGPNNLIQSSDGNFYGTTAQGGANNAGTVFRIASTGEFTSLYSFVGGTSSLTPLGVVQGRDGNLYGTTTYGGAGAGVNGPAGYGFNGYGTVFRLTPAGGFTLLHSFIYGGDGASPGVLIQGSDGNFYGTTAGPQNGFNTGSVTAFKISPGGDFTTIVYLDSSIFTEPSLAMTQGSDGNFYALSLASGEHNGGAVYQITPVGQVLTLYRFNAFFDNGNLYGPPVSPLLQGNDGNFYGTTGSALYRLTLLPLSAQVPVITTDGLPIGEQGVAYGYQIVATPAAEVFSATGLPSGLTISTNGVISGTPTVSGTFQVTVSAMNQAGTGTAVLTLYLAGLSPVITSAPTATVQAGQPFTYQITSDTPGASFGASDLPVGLSVTAAGLISGTVAAPGTYNVTLEVANALNNFSTLPLTLTVSSVAVAAHPAFFTGEASLGESVYYLAFPASGTIFGYYAYLSDPNYIYHFDLGFEYVFDAADGHSGVYLYDFKSNTFFYTSPTFPFPYLYDFNLNSFVYYYPDPNNAGHYNTDGIRYFYVFATGQNIAK